jgi:hypothetical protein
VPNRHGCDGDRIARTLLMAEDRNPRALLGWRRLSNPGLRLAD